MCNLSIGQKQALTSCVDIDTICQPLYYHTEITNFSYARVYKNAGQITLATRADWLERYFSMDGHLYKLYLETPEFLKNEYAFWTCTPENSVIKDARECFNISNGVTLIQHHEDYSEVFNFGATTRDSKIMNWYINNLEVLKQFVLYFKDRTQPLTSSIEPTKSSSIQLTAEISKLKLQVKQAKVNDSFMILEPKHVVICVNENEIVLTKAEYHCLKLLALGNTAKSIGQKMAISCRTVESYIYNIKRKTNCHYKTDLINLISMNKFF